VVLYLVVQDTVNETIIPFIDPYIRMKNKPI